MGTKKNLKVGMILGLAALSLATKVQAGPVPMDPNAGRMEAVAECQDGSCYRHEGGLDNVRSMIQKVNIHNAQGIDPRIPQAQTGAGAMFAPIGRLTTDQPVPYIEKIYDEKLKKYVSKPLVMGQTWATAFFVSPCIILTNYHAVFGHSKNPNKTDFSVTFANKFGRVSAKPIAWGAIMLEITLPRIGLQFKLMIKTV